MLRSVIRAILALGVLGAVATQFHDSVLQHGSPADHFLGFFTIQSNIFAAALLLLMAFGGWSLAKHPAVVTMRGAATLYLILTGVVYAAIPMWAARMAESWVNVMVHFAAPVAIVVDWFTDPVILLFDRDRVRTVSAWLAYPITFAIYTLIHGAQTHWYPYTFLDPRIQGYFAVAINLTTISIFCFVVGVLLARFVPRQVVLQPIRIRSQRSRLAG